MEHGETPGESEKWEGVERHGRRQRALNMDVNWRGAPGHSS